MKIFVTTWLKVSLCLLICFSIYSHDGVSNENNMSEFNLIKLKLNGAKSFEQGLSELVALTQKGSDEARIELARVYLHKIAALEICNRADSGCSSRTAIEKAKNRKEIDRLSGMANELYSKTVEAEYKEGYFPFGLFLTTSTNKYYDLNKGKKLIVKAAKLNIPNAQLYLSQVYLDGVSGFEKNFEQSSFWAEKYEENIKNSLD
jgi:hypothetical protein